LGVGSIWSHMLRRWHTGSGYVNAIGSKVTVAQPGDPVLLSFAYCGSCHACQDDVPSYCTSFNDLNFLGTKTFKLASSDKSKGHSISGTFFGQSSFASLSVVSEKSIVNVKDLLQTKQELALLAPLGCGIQTGAGTIINVAKAGPKDAVVVLGMGGVGLSGIIAAKIMGCRTIIGVDKVESRLALAKELGATDVIDGSKLGTESLVEKVRSLTDGLGATATMDTTGVTALAMQAIEFTRNHGKIIQVGSNPIDAKADFPMFMFMVSGKQFVGAIEGESVPSRFVPQLMKWYHEGKFPLDKMVKTFKAEEWEQAIHEMHTGETIKPVLLW
jgi:Zn-dependent alcohol dehydrogenase